MSEPKTEKPLCPKCFVTRSHCLSLTCPARRYRPDRYDVFKPIGPHPMNNQGIERETIVAAAHLFRLAGHEDTRAVPVIVSAPPPARHHNLFALTWPTPPDESGFLTSTGRFVRRDEALLIAKGAEQSFIDHPSRHAHLLFSEDLW